MNKTFIKILPGKAGAIACLFLCTLLSFRASAQEWKFSPNSQKAYDLVMNLQIDEALALIPEPRTVQEYYIVSLAEALELMVTEDGSKFSEYERNFKTRMEIKIRPSRDEDYHFFHADVRLHWAFVYMKFGHEFDAAHNLREAYLVATELERRSPNYLPMRKTSGLLEIMIGSVPEKYTWALSLLGMQGSIPHGLHDLRAVRNSNSVLAFEADLLYSLAQGFVFQRPDSALAELTSVLRQRPDNRLALFVAASLAIKNSQSEDALNLLTSLTEKTHGLPLYYADYLKGEIYLHKADYVNAISSYRWFLHHFAGQNYIKDAHYKIALCYWLNGNVNDAMSLFKEARVKGKEASEADKAAARSLADKELPHVILTKARFFTDGGYYKEAEQLLSSIADKGLTSKRNQVEYFYRKARLAHKTNQQEAAKSFYTQTIERAGDETWYFAPNACLQMGYIVLAEGDRVNAKGLFEKALSYKQHEYKNSIDSKAKSALGRLR